MTACPGRSRACRSMARSESLSSTIRIWAGAFTRRRLPEPAGGNAGSARLFLDVVDPLLQVDDLGANPIHLDNRLLPIDRDAGPLIRIVAADEVGRQPVDPRLQRVEQNLVAVQTLARLVDAGTPPVLALRPIFPARLGGSSVRRVLGLDGVGWRRGLWRRRHDLRQIVVGENLCGRWNALPPLLLLTGNLRQRWRLGGGHAPTQHDDDDRSRDDSAANMV